MTASVTVTCHGRSDSRARAVRRALTHGHAVTQWPGVQRLHRDTGRPGRGTGRCLPVHLFALLRLGALNAGHYGRPRARPSSLRGGGPAPAFEPRHRGAAGAAGPGPPARVTGMVRPARLARRSRRMMPDRPSCHSSSRWLAGCRPECQCVRVTRAVRPAGGACRSNLPARTVIWHCLRVRRRPGSPGPGPAAAAQARLQVRGHGHGSSRCQPRHSGSGGAGRGRGSVFGEGRSDALRV